jgi:hypothetical protein
MAAGKDATDKLAHDRLMFLYANFKVRSRWLIQP